MRPCCCWFILHFTFTYWLNVGPLPRCSFWWYFVDSGYVVACSTNLHTCISIAPQNAILMLILITALDLHMYMLSALYCAFILIWAPTLYLCFQLSAYMCTWLFLPLTWNPPLICLPIFVYFIITHCIYAYNMTLALHMYMPIATSWSSSCLLHFILFVLTTTKGFDSDSLLSVICI